MAAGAVLLALIVYTIMASILTALYCFVLGESFDIGLVWLSAFSLFLGVILTSVSAYSA